MALKVVVDSSSDIPEKVKDDFIIIPMPVIIDGKSFAEGIDIFPDRFYQDFKHYSEVPKTSQPNPQDILEVYEQVLKEGNEVVAIHLSSGLSSTYQTACMVKEMSSQPDKVHVVDSLGATIGFGLLAIYTAQIVKDKSWEEAEPEIIQVRDKMRYLFTPDHLEYLVKGGRLSKAAGFVGGLLNVKPLLHLQNGKIEVFDKVRTRKSALHKIIETMKNDADEPENQIMAIAHSACPEEAEFLAEEIRAAIQVQDLLIGDIGCVVGSHTGPGTIALCYLAK
ncbi:degV family protein [Syntrophobotulus glycolicus DSM 8271]|uniref:DegV family protein n=1 Tax=Syntrophobotulus glycolicus (strain DSM 8271 / FlGlyR) TaxID=645991 RepID=F0SZI6_SYNGF|nr:DegV family protein [Syntrophobotulus glycolicus]ADY56072.1 degV family protein [Syntrophobotulus glycolicus DSM 8271]